VTRQPDRYVVAHSFAPDPDRRKVESALELWAGALAEGVMAAKLGGDTPVARLHFGPGLRGRARRSAKQVAATSQREE
jgi:hypothetical protein